MIKITIIIVLIIILIITIYYYYRLSSLMINYEKTRLEFVLNKETELKNLENKIIAIANCNEKNSNYKKAIDNINNILSELQNTNKNSNLDLKSLIDLTSENNQ